MREGWGDAALCACPPARPWRTPLLPTEPPLLLLLPAPHRTPHCYCLQILPRQNEKDPSRVDVEVMVREKPMQTADIEAEWGIAPGACMGSRWCCLPGGIICSSRWWCR